MSCYGLSFNVDGFIEVIVNDLLSCISLEWLGID